MSLDLSKPELHLLVLPAELHLYKFAEHRAVPHSLRIDAADNISLPAFHSVTRTPEELSIFTSLRLEKDEALTVDSEGPYACLRIRGPLDLTLTGILFEVTKVLKEAQIAIMAESTFNTDFIAVKSDKFSPAKEALRNAGWTVEE